MIALSALALIMLLGILFTHQIVKPINILSKGAKEISQGNLDHKIKLATNDEFSLLGSQFNEMIKVLKENQKLRDEFVFIAAHELRTPVTAIRGYLSMVLDNSFGEDVEVTTTVIPPVETRNKEEIKYKEIEKCYCKQ